MEREVKQWITVNGIHIPIYEGETKGQAINRHIIEKNEETKEKQIAENKKQAEKLSGKAEEKSGKVDKKKQLEVILASNPAEDDEHTWIREESDILTFEEAMKDYEDDDPYPDWTAKDIANAKKSGKVTIYSSKPIVAGNFVTPSAMEAASYSGDETIYKAVVNTSDVAWIDEGQGQIAIKEKIKFGRISAKGLI